MGRNKARKNALKGSHIHFQTSETEHKPLLYDSVDINFSIKVFAKELLIHVLFPLSVVIGKPCHLFLAIFPAVCYLIYLE